MHPPGEIDECPSLHVCAYAVTHVAVTHVAATYVALPMWRYLGRYRHIGLDETIRNKICYVTARAIVPEGVEYYSARNLHVCSAQREALLCCV